MPIEPKCKEVSTEHTGRWPVHKLKGSPHATKGRACSAGGNPSVEQGEALRLNSQHTQHMISTHPTQAQRRTTSRA
jgi:hypothetical protein